MLNSLHDNIKFTYEQEKYNSLPFLGGLLIRDCKKVNTTVYRKDTHNGLYLHWELFSQITWKRGTLKSLISRAYISPNQSLLEKELEHLKNPFHEKYSYPLLMINQVMKTVEGIRRILYNTLKTRITYAGRKLGTKF